MAALQPQPVSSPPPPRQASWPEAPPPRPAQRRAQRRSVRPRPSLARGFRRHGAPGLSPWPPGGQGKPRQCPPLRNCLESPDEVRKKEKDVTAFLLQLRENSRARPLRGIHLTVKAAGIKARNVRVALLSCLEKVLQSLGRRRWGGSGRRNHVRPRSLDVQPPPFTDSSTTLT